MKHGARAFRVDKSQGQTRRLGVVRRVRNPRRRFTRPWIEGLEPRLMLTGDLLLADPATDSILRFDGASGAPLGAFVPTGSGGLVDPHNPTFGPDGNLYTFSHATGAPKILRYSGSSGAFLGTFVDTGAGGFGGGSTMAFGPDGDLYVATATAQGVLRYDGATGAFLGNCGQRQRHPACLWCRIRPRRQPLRARRR